MYPNLQFLAWLSGGASLLFAAALIGAMIVAITKMRESSKPSKWLLAAIACQFVPMVAGMVLRVVLASTFTSEQFATFSITFGIAQSIFAVLAIALFVTAVYSDRNVPRNSDGEEFLSGNPRSRNEPVEVNPFESPQS